MIDAIQKQLAARYNFLERLDSGQSLAQVWRAVDTHLATRVIIKVYGFNSSARIAALLYAAERDTLVRGLPYVPRLRDTVVENGRIFSIVRDEAPGHSLRKVVEQSGPMRYDRACKAVRAAALIAHRFHTDEPHPLALGDLQAPNFIAENDETLWFVGGGATAPLGRDRGGWSTSSLPRFAYVAPELSGGPTVRTDVWGIGALLYYLLSGEPAPAEGGDDAFTALRSRVKNLPDEIAHFIRRTMAPNPEERLPTALACADALKILLTLKAPVALCAVPPLPPLTIRRIDIDESPVAHAVLRSEPGSLAWAKLADLASAMKASTCSGELSALPSLDILPYDHQLETAKRVLSTPTMAGGAILADEVGLGKTIEALIILQELRARQLADNVLIVAQPQGVLNWYEEVRNRLRFSPYENRFRVYEGIADAGYPLLIVSAAALRLPGHRQALSAKRYDVVVADEAHTLTGVDGQPNALGRAIAALSRRRVLLLTATPVRRRLRELYTLASLIRPGFLGTLDEFVERFEPSTERAEAERRALRAILEGIMVRHRRRDLVGLDFPSRTYRTLVYSASRSSQVAGAVAKPLAGYLSKLDPARRVVVFAADNALRKEIALHLQRSLPDRNILLFGDTRPNRRSATQAFWETAGSILVSGDAGAEGMNWQCADVVVHCDIPWNPSVWEQRVGRVYRLGQRGSGVDIVHLVAPGSRDEAVLALYEHSMGLFDLAMGEAASLLDCLPDPQDRDVQSRLDQAFQTAGVRHSFRGGSAAFNALDRYRAAITAARQQYAEECRQADILDGIFGLHQ